MRRSYWLELLKMLVFAGYGPSPDRARMVPNITRLLLLLHFVMTLNNGHKKNASLFVAN